MACEDFGVVAAPAPLLMNDVALLRLSALGTPNHRCEAWVMARASADPGETGAATTFERAGTSDFSLCAAADPGVPVGSKGTEAKRGEAEPEGESPNCPLVLRLATEGLRVPGGNAKGAEGED